MDRIGHECLDAGEPILTSLIVDEATARCSDGFAKEFRRNDVEERQDCYDFWSFRGASRVEPSLPERGVLRERAARFARVAARPEQAAFRRRVFLAHGGACVVTGCTIPEALDAAHRVGRDWRLGHNRGTDGLLLRKDIHALYDAGRVYIDESGIATFDAEVGSHYSHYVR